MEKKEKVTRRNEEEVVWGAPSGEKETLNPPPSSKNKGNPNVSEESQDCSIERERERYVHDAKHIPAASYC